MPPPEDPTITAAAGKEPAAQSGALQPEDFYLEGPYLVFTAAYHRKRGYCCNSGCRHCPWRETPDDNQHSANG